MLVFRQLPLQLQTPGRDISPSLPIDTYFNETLADELAHLEIFNKHHYRPNTYLHKWWARRCGTTFRLILKHLVADPAGQNYYTPGGLAGKVILDPMMGGGTTLHEAIRLGANVLGADIDPIPVLQARATLSTLPLSQLEEAFATFQQALSEGLAEHFCTECANCGQPTPIRYTLYGLRRECRCGPVILVDSPVLRYAGQEVVDRLPAIGRHGPILEKKETHCRTCGEAYRDDPTQPFYARYEPLVVVGSCEQHGLFFQPLSPADEARLERANGLRDQLGFERDLFAIGPGPKSRDLTGRGISCYLDLFSGRQLLYLRQAIDLLPQFEPLVRLNLALLVSTSLEFNAMLCGYKGVRKGEKSGAIRHTFSYHAYSFPYTTLENNPLYPGRASGTLAKLFHDRIRRARQWAAHPRERQPNGKRAHFVAIQGEQDMGQEMGDPAGLQTGDHRFYLQQGSAVRLPLPDQSVDFVVTDPPYFDSVQYGDLAAFFRVWLSQLYPAGGQWHYNLDETAVNPYADNNGQYVEVLSGIFAECRRVLRVGSGRIIFTFHHWNPKGWAALTIALQRAGLRLVNRYVVRSENPVSVHIAGLQSLTHDAILVLAAETGGDWLRPGQINLSDSATFCRDCATLLGWLLGQSRPEGEIYGIWREALTNE